MFTGFIAALVTTIIITTAIAAFGRKGPWGTIWSMFLILFFTLWLVAVYMRSVGPVYYGIAWIPVLVAGILLSVLLAAAIPDANHWRDESLHTSSTEKPVTQGIGPRTGAGRFFWILIVMMIAAILIGMINPQAAL